MPARTTGPRKIIRSRPYAAEVMPDQFARRECRVRALRAERTFWEKATILHAEFHRPPDNPSKERLTRHYYDLVKLYGRRGREAGASSNSKLLEAVVKHKRSSSRSAWASYDEARPGHFRLVPPDDRLAQLRTDYAEMQEVMIFGESPSFDSLLETLRELEAVINDVLA